LLARRRAPLDLAAQDAVAEVDAALVAVQVGGAHPERLVVHVDADRLGVRRVDQGLPLAGQPERVLGVEDVPRLVEAVDKGSVVGGGATLLGVPAHAQVAVAHGELRLGHSQRRGAGVGLDPAPRVHRVGGPVDLGDLEVTSEVDAVGRADAAGDGLPHGVVDGATYGRDGGQHRTSAAAGTSSARSTTTRSAPASVSAARPAPRSTPTTVANPPAAPACTPETASSITTQCSAGTPSSSAPRR